MNKIYSAPPDLIPDPSGVTIRRLRCNRCGRQHYEISDVMYCPFVSQARSAGMPNAGALRISGQWQRSGAVTRRLLDHFARSIGQGQNRETLLEVAYPFGAFEPAIPENSLSVILSTIRKRLTTSRLELISPGNGRWRGFYKLIWRPQQCQHQQHIASLPSLEPIKSAPVREAGMSI